MELSIAVRPESGAESTSARCTLVRTVTLGRGPESPVPLDGTGISREHLGLHLEADAIFVTDLSSNGTWLNGQRLTKGEPRPLALSDVIRIPGFEIRVAPLENAAADNRNAATLESSAAEAPARASSPLDSARAFAASLSRMDRFVIALAAATLVLAVLYLTS